MGDIIERDKRKEIPLKTRNGREIEKEKEIQKEIEKEKKKKA